MTPPPPSETDGRVVVDDHGGGVRLVTMNRPDRLNAFDTSQYEAAIDALVNARDDDSVSVAVITGAGRAFSSGADTQVLAGDIDDPTRILDAFVTYVETLSAFPKPLLAAVNGAGIGIGMTMLLHCDIVVMADDARLRAPFVSLGVSPEGASSALLPLIVGPQQAARILMTGDWIDAAEAVELGLALKQVPRDRVVDDTLGLASTIAAGDEASLRATKRLLVDARAGLLGDTIRHEVAVLSDLVTRKLAAAGA